MEQRQPPVKLLRDQPTVPGCSWHGCSAAAPSVAANLGQLQSASCPSLIRLLQMLIQPHFTQSPLGATSHLVAVDVQLALLLPRPTTHASNQAPAQQQLTPTWGQLMYSLISSWSSSESSASREATTCGSGSGSGAGECKVVGTDERTAERRGSNAAGRPPPSIKAEGTHAMRRDTQPHGSSTLQHQSAVWLHTHRPRSLVRCSAACIHRNATPPADPPLRVLACVATWSLMRWLRKMMRLRIR